MSAARAQTVLPLDPPKKRQRQSSHETNSNKHWKPEHDAKLVKMIRLPGWNIIAVARELGRPKKGVYNRAVMHYKAGRITSMPSWSDLMAQTDPLLVPQAAPEPAPDAFTPESIRDAFCAPGVTGASCSKKMPRQVVSCTPEPVPCAYCGNPTAETVFIEDAGKRYHIDCHQQYVAEIHPPGADTRSLAVIADAFIGVAGKRPGEVGLHLLFEFDGGRRESLWFGFSFHDPVNEEIATERHTGELLLSLLGAVGAERVDAVAGRVVLVERDAAGAILAFEAPSFVPHAGRFDRAAFCEAAVA